MRGRARIVTGLLLLGAAGCADLDVQNPNKPNTEGVLAAPEDVESLIAGSYFTWWDTNVWDPNRALSVAAFEHGTFTSCCGGVDFSWLPERRKIDNTAAWSFADVIEHGWHGLYAANASATNGLRRIDGGVRIVAGGADRTPRARAFARFVQGISHGSLALLYDQGFVFDETTDPDEAELQPYDDVMEAALGYLDEAIALSEANTFTIPAEWMAGNAMPSQDLARLARSYRARYRAQVARTPAQRAAVDWARVIADVEAGIREDYTPVMDRAPWWNFSLIYKTLPRWSAVDYHLLGMADTSGEYQRWIAKAPFDRLPFVIRTPDLRFPQGAEATGQRAKPGRYVKYDPANVGQRPERGPWRWSNYMYNKYDYHLAGPPAYTGPTPEMTVAEMRLLKAEGLIRQGKLAAAAELVNVTRVGVGGLPPVTPAGVPNAPDCVPRLPNGECGDLFEALKWEKRLETFFTGIGMWFNDSRGWGDLPRGTFLHLPVPAAELELLQLPLYTHGGGEGDSAPASSYGYPGY